MVVPSQGSALFGITPACSPRTISMELDDGRENRQTPRPAIPFPHCICSWSAAPVHLVSKFALSSPLSCFPFSPFLSPVSLLSCIAQQACVFLFLFAFVLILHL